jgi:hypothetical protein
LRPFSLLLILAVSSPAFASERRIGQIVATTTPANNLTTAATFSIRATGDRSTVRAVVQCDAAAYVNSYGCSDSSCTAATTDTKIAADHIYDVSLVGTESVIAVRAVTGTATCQVRIRYL